MRITYIHQYFKTPAMSGGTRSYEFARRLVERGHEVHMITGDPDADRPRVTREAGIVVHWLPVPYSNAMSYRRRLRSFLGFVGRSALVAGRLRHDLVLATSTPLTVAIPGVWAALRRRVPMVLEVRDVWPELPIALGALTSPVSRWAAGRLEAWAYHRSEQVIALSPGMAASIRRRFPDVPVTVVPNSSDRELFAGADRAGAVLRRETPWLGDRPLVLYAGTLGLANGVDYLVRMAAQLADIDPEVRVAVIGDGRMRDGVRDLAVELGVLDRNLFLLDPVSKAGVVAFFGACDLAASVFVDVPELGANSPNKVFDAFAAGRPVAVNHGGWVADLITETGAGLVLPPADTAAAAAAVAGFLGDREACRAARAAAYALARDRFDRDLLFEDFERVLAESQLGSRTGARAGRTAASSSRIHISRAS
ncbi:glycosyltransferase family 4 protein [Actinoplanes xinjiangensis]|uniref:Glycosyltransferase involved in cell wall biosynthesis n=1 Tax=Actinoplanes xinjiangensis TaxID=512350 RepID=A0A316FJZ0_9ACTN|nr:glycosyltransferase family 4 protein [Actinoplanes xinjiangensis]PWK48432.1 glycosyltransferase involved in cell wall biosynthesis [Actinoplanes xinjiangensis]GIF38813.1 glycosyltransferase WbuB [Actinoplanes xinjiangensis]